MLRLLNFPEHAGGISLFGVRAVVLIGILMRKFAIQTPTDFLVQALVIPSFLPSETFDSSLASLGPMGSKECLKILRQI